MERDIRTQLRDERIPYASVVTRDDAIRVTLRDAANLSTAVASSIRENDRERHRDDGRRGGRPDGESSP